MAEPSQSTAASALYDPRVRGYAYQALLVAVLAALIWSVSRNVYVNMQARGVPTGFGFWDQTAGLRHQPDVDPLFLAVDLRSGVLGRAMPTPRWSRPSASRWRRRSASHRRGASFAELDSGENRDGLRGDHAQYAAAAAVAVLVQRGAEGAARAPVSRSRRSAWSSSTIAVSMRRARVCAPARSGSRSPCWRGSPARWRGDAPRAGARL